MPLELAEIVEDKRLEDLIEDIDKPTIELAGNKEANKLIEEMADSCHVHLTEDVFVECPEK